VLVEKFALNKSLQWQDDTTVHRLHELGRDVVLDNLI
jgi:hypothetical protein